MSGNKVPKTVSFNKTNAVDKLILDYVKNKNFSGLCKKLLIEEMKQKGIEVPRRKRTPRTTNTEEQTKTQASPPQETAAEKLARIQGELKKRLNNSSD